MFTGNGLSLSDIAAVTGRGNGDGWGDGNGWWILIILFAIFGGWGNTGYGRGAEGGVFGGSNGVTDGYVLASDFANIERKIDGVNNGLCDGFYAMNTGMLNGFAGITNAITTSGYETRNAIQADTVANMQNTNALQAQLANCCCENRQAIAQVRYDMATDTCAIQNSINGASRDIIDNQNANTRSILDFLVNDKIATLQAENQNLKLQASQASQNTYLLNELKPCPIPAYITCSPYQSYSYGCGCNTCNG